MYYWKNGAKPYGADDNDEFVREFNRVSWTTYTMAWWINNVWKDTDDFNRTLSQLMNDRKLDVIVPEKSTWKQFFKNLWKPVR